MKSIFLAILPVALLLGCAKKPCVPGNPHDWNRLQEELKAKGEEYNPDDYRHCDTPKSSPPRPTEESDWSIISVPAANPYRNQIKD